MKEKNNVNIKLFLTILVGLLIVIGSSFAIYNIVIKGQKENLISTSKLSFTYSEPLEKIDLLSYNTLTDAEGTSQSDYYEFSVKGSSTANETLYYTLYLSKIMETYNFNDSDIKIYLTSVNNNIETQVVGPTLVSSLLYYSNVNTYRKIYTNTFTFNGVNLEEQVHTYRLRIWIKDEMNLNNYITFTTNNGEKNIKLNEYKYSFKLNAVTIKALDTSGANKPELVTGMIPVYYDSNNDTWRKADSSNINTTHQWYSYTDTMWANAVTVTAANRATYQSAALGTAISMDDINTMWVWIPRFNAVTPSNYNGGTQTAPGAIDVTFVNNTTTALDAFTFGDQTLSGFWYGKFETGHATLSSSTTANNLGCSNETCSNANGLIIKPNVISLRNNDVSNFFYAARSMEQSGNAFGFNNTIDTTLDTHMSKNNEWGAVAYLTQSIYGRCTSSTSCTEVTINNCENFITGIGGDTVSAGSSSTTCTTAVNKYNGTKGVLASTTETIYGIYDMSGGAYDYVMGNYNNYSGYDATYNSGFNGAYSAGGTKTDGSAFPVNKYYNLYTGTSYTGHALTETSGWYSDGADFVNSNSSWFRRGGYFNNNAIAGVFSFYFAKGLSNSYNGFRPVVVK